MSPAPKSASEPNRRPADYDVGGAGGSGGGRQRAMEEERENRCQFFLPSKRRFCANTPLSSTKFCGNHNPSQKSQRLPCPIDPSHSVLRENLDSHVKKCPFKKQAEALETKPYYSKGINGGGGTPEEEKTGSEAKRRAVHKLSLDEFDRLIGKIRAFHSWFQLELLESFAEPDACTKWLKQQIDRQVPYQEKHVMQQISILGNMEAFGILKKPLGSCQEIRECDDMGGEKDEAKAVIEFGAGRGYLTHMLADCYGLKKIFMVERRSYKLKADRSLRQDQSINLERLRIDIEDLNLHAIESLKGHQYLAIGKHLCGSATDLAIRCCFPYQHNLNKKVLSSNCYLQGLALATCCHHLCQWNSYINTSLLSERGITKEDFDAITWFSSWAVDADHSSGELPNMYNEGILHSTREAKEPNQEDKGVEEIIKGMQSRERAGLGFMCKEIIDLGRLLWLRDHALDAQLVKYVPSSVSPENHLLVAKCRI